MTISLTPEQGLAAETRNRALLVSAAAGSGKTRVLVERVLSRIIDERLSIDEFLIITFTNAAALEMRSRIMTALTGRLADDPSDRHLRHQLALMGRAQIMTIDAFCLSLLREHPHLTEFPSGFRVADTTEAELLRRRVLEETIEEQYERLDDLPDFGALLAVVSSGRDDRALFSLVEKTYVSLESQPFPDEWMARCLRDYESDDTSDFSETLFGRILLSAARERMEGALAALTEARALLIDEPILGEKYLPAILTDIDDVAGFLSAPEWDGALARLAGDLAPIGRAPAKYPYPELKERVRALRDLYKKEREGAARLLGDTSAVLHGELRAVLPAVRGLFSLVSDFRRAFLLRKERRRILEFADISRSALALLCRREDGKTVPTDVARNVGARYREILVDEYQDTNNVQELLVSLLSGGRRNVFYVGDVKQSIYRFRLASPELFLARLKASDPVRPGDASEAPGKISLAENFRSRPEVIDAVNSIFRHLLVGDFTGIDYLDGEALKAGRSDPADARFAPELLLTDMAAFGEDEESEEASPSRIDREAEAVASRIEALLAEQLPIPEGEGTRPVRPSDIAVLFRSLTGRANRFRRALERRGIHTVGSENSTEKTAELHVLLSYLRVIDNPYADIPLIAVLRSPVWRFSPDELAAVRRAAPAEPFYTALSRAAEGGDARALAFLDSLRAFREAKPDMQLSRFLRHLYQETQLPAYYSALPDGPSRRRNLLYALEYAAEFERSARPHLSEFVDFLERRVERGEFGGDGDILGDAVRFLTIHKSKGLEFPVVILADAAKQVNLDDLKGPVLLHAEAGVGLKVADSERMLLYPTAAHTAIAEVTRLELLAEEMRVLYVALTRAREKLIVSASFANLERVLKKVEGVSLDRGPSHIRALKSARSTAEWVLLSLLPLPASSGLREAFSLPAPTGADGPDWHISVTQGSMESTFDECPADENGHSVTPHSEDPGPRLDEVVDACLAYRYPFEPYVSLPSKLTATELKGRFLDTEAGEGAASPPPSDPPPLRRPRFLSEQTGLTPAEQGTALHMAMQFMRFEGIESIPDIEAEIRRLRHDRYLTEAQAKAVRPEPILRFLLSPLGARIRKSDRVLREFKFSLLSDAAEFSPGARAGEEDVLLQGVVDLFFEEDGALHVVDFKTDRVTEETQRARAAFYAPQIETYAAALSRIFGLPVGDKVCYFFATGEAEFL